MKSVYFALVLMLVPALLHADPLTPFEPGSTKVKLEDALPHYDRPENKTNEFYSEWWAFVFRLDDGYTAYVQFLISNMGPGDGKGFVKVEFGTPDGRKYKTTSEYSSSQWSWQKDQFLLQFGDNRLSGPLNNLKIQLENKDLSAELVIENIAQPWKPGTAKAQYGKKKTRYYAFQYLVPVGKVSGTVKTKDNNKEHQIKGLIHSDHSVASIGPHEQAQTWARFRVLGEKTTLLVSDIRTPKVYGGAPIRQAVLFRNGKVVFESVDFNVSLSDPYVDPKKSGYQAPRLMEISGTTQKGNFRGAIKATKLTSSEDFLESSGAAARFIISKFAKPVMYYFDGIYAIEVEVDGKPQEFKGRGSYYYTVMNP